MDRILHSSKGAGSGKQKIIKRLFDLNQTPEENELNDLPKAVGQSSVADKNGDDAFVVIRDRKVQVSEGTSLYAQSRSWLKNGQEFDKQPQQYPDCVKPLPKPLPATKVEATKEDDMEIDEMPENVDHLTHKELLQLHINRAKKVRARKRNERLQKIERYKDRLALLLPPVAEEKPKNEHAS